MDEDFKRDIKKDERYKRLRTRLRLSNPKVKVISITSILDGEGKTEIAYELAKSFALLNEKVLLIDGNLKKYDIAKKLDIKGKGIIFGLAAYLSGEADSQDIITKIEKNNLQYILNTEGVANASEVLDDLKLKGLIDDFKEMYDYIIIDTPSLESSVDGLLIGNLSDGILLVIEENKVEKDMLIKQKQILDEMGIQLLGTVLNKTRI